MYVCRVKQQQTHSEMDRLDPIDITKTQRLFKTADGWATTTYETTINFFQVGSGAYVSSYTNYQGYAKITKYKNQEAWEAAHARTVKKYSL